MHSKTLLNDIVNVCSKSDGTRHKSVCNIFKSYVEKWQKQLCQAEFRHCLCFTRFCHLVAIINVLKQCHEH